MPHLKFRFSIVLLILIIVQIVPHAAADNLAAADPVLALPPVRDSDDRWGLNHTYSVQQYHEMTRDAGAHWNRWEVRWRDIEPARTDFHYGNVDGMVSQSLQNDLSIQAILISIPDWARDSQTQLPSGLYRAWDDPQNFWGRWVRTTAQRYKGRVKSWEAWNEPDLAEVFWPGSTADYYQLLKVTYLNLKYVDPTNQVLLAGLEYWNNMPFLDDLLKLMMADPTAPGNNYYFDVLPWHQYSRPSDVYDRVLQSRQKLAQTIGVKPIWVNEAGVSAWDESPQYNFQPYQWAATLQEQASYVIEAGAYAIAAGADKFFFYRLQDTAWPEALGLVRLDRTLRPSYVAYQVASHNLSFIDSATLQHMQNVEAIAMRRGTDRVTVVWNRTPNRLVAAIGARATTATVTDQTGATRTVRATGGAFQLDLGPATANNGVDATDYFIGGPPLILLESPAAQQTAEETNPVLSYGGSWDVLSTPGASGGAVRRAAVPGLGVAVDFDGPSVTWVTTKGPDHGIARVTVDGAVQADIDLYDPTELADIPYTFGEFSSGTHRFVMTILSQVNGASTGTLVDVDTISAQTLRQAPPPPTPSPVSSPTPTASPTPRPTATPIASPTPIATATPPLSPTPTVSPLVTVVTGTTGSTPAEPLEAIIDEIS